MEQKNFSGQKKQKSFLKLVAEKNATDEFTNKIQGAIDFIHLNEEARNSYMTIGMKIAEECKYAREEGLAEGRAEERADNIRNMLIENVPVESIKRYIGCDDEVIERIKKEIAAEAFY